MNLSAFYTGQLVPAAQVLMTFDQVFQTLVGTTNVFRTRLGTHGLRSADEVRNLMVSEAFDALNLVNCELQSWRTLGAAEQAKLEQLTPMVEALTTMWVSEIKNWSDVSKLPLAKVLSHVLFRGPNTGRAGPGVIPKLAQRAVDLLPRQQETCRRIFAVIGYKSTERHAWLASRAGRDTPLFKDGRISTWRTLARNLSWEMTFQLLGMNNVPASAPVFGSRVGRETVHALFAASFHGKTEAPVYMMSPASRPIPGYIDLSRSEDGHLLLKASYSPPTVTLDEAGKLVLEDLTLWSEIQAKGSQALRDCTKLQTNSIVCAADRLAQGIERLKTWHESLTAAHAVLLEQVRQALEKRREEEALSKLMSSFSPEELLLLKKHFQSAKA